ncbi:protein ORF94 [Cyprinid herpesvirus 3]|uniref:ORF94L n=2 Tax=Cyprinid herpesvirus 3 TaxID=180230 RepID=A0A060IBN6_CYHV3|nr:ORF94L [Cyprinid herpesvirus 3]AJP55582.1 protein ORF94 [Cyprinid herpesvirus 3]AJP55737.1 protein ORF94 [Cyprinid herpesvirus 3]AVL27550.1 protein ORF94 [Cyprinid herpesvirus 3]AVL27707.1 protein ORF94 [Cyprinid herpesvirus 3]
MVPNPRLLSLLGNRRCFFFPVLATLVLLLWYRSTPVLVIVVPAATQNQPMYRYVDVVDNDSINALHATTNVAVTVNANGQHSKLMGGMVAIAVPPYLGVVSDNLGLFCGATLYNATHALTAGHCCINGRTQKLDSVVVAFGLFSITELYQPGVVRHKVVACHFYAPDFMARARRILADPIAELFNWNGYDVALMELDRPAAPSKKPVELFERGEHEGEEECLVAGYGLRGYPVVLGANMAELEHPVKTIHVPLVDKFRCDRDMPERTPPFTVCAGSFDHDVCLGDSGGPLMCESSRDHRPRQLGIVSYGRPCVRGRNGLSVYTDVRAYNLKEPTYTVRDMQSFLLDVKNSNNSKNSDSHDIITLSIKP